MKSRLLLASSALAMAALAGIAQADLAQDLATMPAGQALDKALQDGDQSIATVISAATEQLQDQPELLARLVVAAIGEFPEQTAQIVYVSVCQGSGQNQASIGSALTSAAQGNAALQTTISQTAADCQLALANITATEEAEQTEIEAEQTEITAQVPPPPAITAGANDRPPAISPN